MTTWTSDELTRIGAAEELEIASLRRDGRLASPRTIWVVRHGDALYVRSVNGRTAAWFRGTQVRRQGRIEAGGVSKDVIFVDPDSDSGHDLDDELDAAYRAKYRRYAPSIVNSIVSPQARSATVKLVPGSAGSLSDIPLEIQHERRRHNVEILPKQPSVKAPAETFTGGAWYDVIAQGKEPSRLRVNVVRFAPGARNAWHSHARGQTLHVTEGIGLIQSRDGQVTEIRPGDTIYTPPGEWHWHGAAPDHFMTHLAMWEGPGEGQGPETEWGDLVTDAEYSAAPAT